MHHYQDLITIFNDCFFDSHHTKLVRGEDEPLYLPADENRPFHAIFFAHGFFSSALHECAHWLIAGAERRLKVDFGYWYIPDGRNATQQALFQQVEVKPQAMECIFSVACGFPFHISVDNLHGETLDNDLFKQAIYQQVKKYCREGLPARAAKFHHALCHFYNQEPKLNIDHFEGFWV